MDIYLWGTDGVGVLVLKHRITLTPAQAQKLDEEIVPLVEYDGKLWVYDPEAGAYHEAVPFKLDA